MGASLLAKAPAQALHQLLVSKPFTHQLQLTNQPRRLPVIALASLQRHQTLMNIRQPLLIRPRHWPALVRREAITVEVHQINVVRRPRNTFLKDLRAFIDQRQQTALKNLLRASVLT